MLNDLQELDITDWLSMLAVSICFAGLFLLWVEKLPPAPGEIAAVTMEVCHEQK